MSVIPTDLTPLGLWRAGADAPSFGPHELPAAIARVREPLHVVRDRASGRLGVAFGGELLPGAAGDARALPLLATLPALYPEWLGDRSFGEVHGVRFPYVVGEMANGIATTRMVIEAGRAGMIGFFGSAGLGIDRIGKALDVLEAELGSALPWGVNLIHSPQEPDQEDKVADLLIRRNVARVSASAYMALTPAIVRYAATGLTQDASGRVHRAHHVFAKISRPEVARHFLRPAPAEILRGLVARGLVTPAEADLAARVPVAEDLTVEGDSGGHTDNQTLTALVPTILTLCHQIAEEQAYGRPIRVGAAGGLGTPGAVAAAFALGAAYVVTGSVNQSAVEAGLSDPGQRLLAQADIAVVMMAPAADMFELGVKVQVLKRGTMFGVRGLKLYEAYVAWPSFEAMPAEVRQKLERDVLHATIDAIWAETSAFWRQRDPAEVARADREPKHKMALVFRWYLGKASRWAIDGDPDRRADYQIWCGSAMGAFNAWARGSFLEAPLHRTTVQIGRNLLEGAAVVTRAQQLRTYGVAVPPSAFEFRPRFLA